MLLGLMMLSGSAMAQVTEQREPFTGSISGNITNAAGDIVSTETGKVDVTLSDGCTWNLTADTHITSFTGDASQIKSNGHRLWVNGKEMKM